MCERCGSQVEQKRMRQRVIRITDYAERLLAGLEELDQRPAHIKHMQKNWIGKSEGTEFTMQVADTDHHVQIYTTRIDTIYGMSYIALAPEHPLVDQITTEENRKNVQEYIEQSKKKTQLQRSDLNKDKTGICTGSYAIHPFT
jgi:leucyl-tRNA synthetase